jgi:hypothetical protein
MNPPNKANTLRLYSLGLLLVGLASVLFNSQTNIVEWYPTGKSGLIANGICALFALGLSFPAAKDKLWAHYAGAALAFLLLIYGFSQAFTIGRSLQNATPATAHLWYKATLFGATALVSLLALMPILIYVRRERV